MPKVYPLETVERGLQVLATLGSSTLAHKALKQEGHAVPRQTLELWRNSTHKERYHAVCSEVAPKIRERLAAENEQLADRLMRLEHQMVDSLEAKADTLDPKDISNALRNASVSKGLAIDKAQTLRDRPTAIVEHTHSIEDLDKLISALDQAEPQHVDAEAEVVEDSEVGGLPSETERQQRPHEQHTPS